MVATDTDLRKCRVGGGGGGGGGVGGAGRTKVTQ